MKRFLAVAGVAFACQLSAGTNGFLVVTNQVALAPVTSRAFDLTYADAEDIAGMINRSWTGWTGPGWHVREVAVPLVGVNAVMVTAPADVLDACAKIVAKVDRKPRQVYIEARFVELKNTSSYNLGIDWSALDGLKGTASFGAGLAQQHLPDHLKSYKQGNGVPGTSTSYQAYEFGENAGGVADMSYFQGTLSISQMSLMLSAFRGSADVHMFSNPKVIVASGRKAIVDMTTKRPNVILSTKRVTKSGENTVDADIKVAAIPGEDKRMFAREAFFSWGISLEVTPRVTTNGVINVKIVPTLSEPNGEVAPTITGDDSASVSYPIIDVQRIVTEFNLKSGMTAVIGGLSRTEEEDLDSGIPWLGDIPWIGDKLFGGKYRSKVQRDVIVFVTVGETDAERIKPDTGLPKNAVLGRGYTNGSRQEPGDRTNAVEGVMSLDMTPIDERAQRHLED